MIKIAFFAIFIWAFSVYAQTPSIITVRAEHKSTVAVTQEMPEFPGGNRELLVYISRNIVYPKVAKDSVRFGTCYIRFTVDTAGSIKDAKVLKGVPKCPECDNEALRVIRSMPRWKPGRHNTKPVNVFYNVPIFFELR